MMKFLRCKVCGKIVALVNDCSSCPTKCCGEAMEEIPVNTEDGAHEKHVPVYEVVGNIVKVRIGEVDHLQQQFLKHFQFIERTRR